MKNMHCFKCSKLFGHLKKIDLKKTKALRLFTYRLKRLRVCWGGNQNHLWWFCVWNTCMQCQNSEVGSLGCIAWQFAPSLVEMCEPPAEATLSYTPSVKNILTFQICLQRRNDFFRSSVRISVDYNVFYPLCRLLCCLPRWWRGYTKTAKRLQGGHFLRRSKMSYLNWLSCDLWSKNAWKVCAFHWKRKISVGKQVTLSSKMRKNGQEIEASYFLFPRLLFHRHLSPFSSSVQVESFNCSQKLISLCFLTAALFACNLTKFRKKTSNIFSQVECTEMECCWTKEERRCSNF